jgi:hypothetical protein
METLENWYVQIITSDKGTPREHKVPILIGKFEDKNARVFRITGFDPRTKVLSSNELSFLLGTPRKEYEERFPNAKEKMHEALTRAIFRSNRKSNS